MPPRAEDLRVAESISERIVSAGQDRVRRVVMIGSRAVGTAHPESDLDLVVIVEIPISARPWLEGDIAAERTRLYAGAGSAPVRLDIAVRTTDHYAEAFRVVGGPEHLVATEGVVVYSRALDRPPVVRRTPDQVRFVNVSTWIKHALLAADRAAAAENAKALGSTTHEARRDPQALGRAAVERALNAVLVLHKIHVEKRIGVQGMLSCLEEVEPHTVERLRPAVHGALTARVAYAVVGILLKRLATQPAVARLLAPTLAKLDRPVILLGG